MPKLFIFGGTPDGHVCGPTQLWPLPSAPPAHFDLLHHSWTHTHLATPGGVVQVSLAGLSDSSRRDVRAVYAFHDARVIQCGDGVVALLVGGAVKFDGDDIGDGEATFERAAEGWCDVVATDAGPALAYRGGDGVYAFPSLNVLSGATRRDQGVKLEHPLLRRGRVGGMVATESRAALLVGGEVLVASWDWRRFSASKASNSANAASRGTAEGGREYVPALQVVDELSGLGVTKLVGGRGNRIGVVTGAGEAYLLHEGEVEQVAFSPPKDGQEGQGEEEREGQEEENEEEEEGEIDDLALGPDFELVLSNNAVWARGNNEFGQLGQGHTLPVEGWVRIPLPPKAKATGMLASRFSGLVECA